MKPVHVEFDVLEVDHLMYSVDVSMIRRRWCCPAFLTWVLLRTEHGTQKTPVRVTPGSTCCSCNLALTGAD